MSTLIETFFRKLAAAVSVPVILSEFFHPATGQEYGIGWRTKLRLVFRMRRNRRKIPTASHFLEHLIIATEIMKVPRSIQGSVVECGSYKGGSAANLSLVCALCDRQLEIFDSFQGLPRPASDDREHILIGAREIHSYEQGAFAGTLEEVKRNLINCGNISVCRFRAGYFDQTLPDFKTKCVLAFLDVDLVASVQTCVEHLWPLLQDGCYLFIHEAHHMEVAALFFNDEWWSSRMGSCSPGLVGAGNGLGLQPASGGYTSCLGFTLKNPKLGGFMHHPQKGVISR